jgi:hypothetical protein
MPEYTSLQQKATLVKKGQLFCFKQDSKELSPRQTWQNTYDAI